VVFRKILPEISAVSSSVDIASVRSVLKYREMIDTKQRRRCASTASGNVGSWGQIAACQEEEY
jgi:hypothetical protein